MCFYLTATDADEDLREYWRDAKAHEEAAAAEGNAALVQFWAKERLGYEAEAKERGLTLEEGS